MSGRYLIFSIHYNFKSGIWQKKKRILKKSFELPFKTPTYYFSYPMKKYFGQVRFATTITQISHAFSSAPSRLQNLLHSILHIYFTLALVASLLPLKMEHSSGIAVDVPQKRPKNHQDNPNAASGKNTFELGQFNQSECDLSILISCKDRATYIRLHYSTRLNLTHQINMVFGSFRCQQLLICKKKNSTSFNSTNL